MTQRESMLNNYQKRMEFEVMTGLASVPFKSATDKRLKIWTHFIMISIGGQFYMIYVILGHFWSLSPNFEIL